MSHPPDQRLSVSVTCDGENHEIRTCANEYRSLMMLIYDKIYTEDFGECLGMGKCGTCRVEIISSKHELNCYERNEETTLTRSGQSGKDVRLSCQVMADKCIDGLKVNILS